MFESICFRHRQPLYNEDLDICFLAEAMLFYQNVHLIADAGVIKQLAYECGPALLNEFIEEGFLKISYLEKIIGIAPYNNGLIHPITVVPAKGEWHLEKVAPEIFSKAAGGPGYGRQLGRRFASLVPTLDIGDDAFSMIKADFSDQTYVEKAIRQLLSLLAPAYFLPQDYKFKIFKEGNCFRVDTNIDFRQANDSFNKCWQKEGELLTDYSLLIYLFDARNDLIFASKSNSELATSPGIASVIDTKFHEILNARSKSQHNIEVFQGLELADSHEIGESLKKNYRTWREFLELLKEARKFKGWLQQQKQDASLIREYKKALEKDTWFGELPTKFLRFLIFTIAETALPPPLSIALSTADTFLVDPLLAGWKPNQFVNGPLKSFARLD